MHERTTVGLDEQLLDDAEGLAAADPSGSLRALASAGAQIRRALTATEEARIHADRPRRPAACGRRRQPRRFGRRR